ncbi:uncharacterized mitochondrial protein AtMg00810-like [Ricinus communis]|uniref:uncharacterized mitochondrial protein AtMg00810-like n=1 Tax=Ricinus communis TaxID=3988 RepID=UPI000772B9F3|nr:uncharacterized mitochondrial protein AtMg00810-like [Ricinus communis]|eukprot:XP_015575554.1 uncharacterized protein LOC107261369 [Ricinus communis]
MDFAIPNTIASLSPITDDIVSTRNMSSLVTSFMALVYIDDILVTNGNSNKIQVLITQLNQPFALKDLGKVSYFLGIQVHSTTKGLHLSQFKCISNLLQKTRMLCKGISTPMVSSLKLSASGSKPIDDVQLYKSTVSALYTLQYGLHLKRSNHLDVIGFSDADWASDPNDRRSTLGFCVLIGDNLLSWNSKKQSTVSRSSTEAKYKSLASLY